jgi:hypothetical protein
LAVPFLDKKIKARLHFVASGHSVKHFFRFLRFLGASLI